MAPRKLASDEIEQVLADLEGWDLRDEKLYKRFEFRGLRARVRIHEQCRLGGGVDEPSPRVVQRVQPGRDPSHHA